MQTSADAQASVTPRWVAERHGVSVSTVRRLVYTGVIPAYRTPGGHYRIPRDVAERPILTPVETDGAA